MACSAPLDHFHGRGLEATREIAELLAIAAGDHLLDIGCGIGGPARWIARRYDCRVSGIDLTPEFCAAAQRLTELCAMTDRVSIEVGNALDLAFADQSFDRAYAQNVLMNIADKAAFAREAFRVLKPGGRLVLSVLTVGNGEALDYPVPWAESARASFIETSEACAEALTAAGFAALDVLDRTQTYVDGLAAMRKRIQEQGPPRLGVHVLMGERIKLMQRNSSAALSDGRIIATEISARRP